MAIPRPCGFCKKSVMYKPTALYWRWQPFGQESRGFVAQACDECFVTKVAPYMIWDGSIMNEDEPCPGCGGSMKDDVNYVWGDVYPREADHMKGTAVMCGACGLKFRHEITSVGKRLQDREPAPAREANSFWVQLGIDTAIRKTT